MTARYNYEKTDIEIGSFFNYARRDFVTDAVVMNPPFSIEFKNLSEEEKENIQKEFDWKNSGKIDDIFVLKSLKYTKRFGFYILFPGVCYRKTEQKFRELIGNTLAELNLIKNAFNDAPIEVVFVVIDKQKTSNYIEKEIYNCKLKRQIHYEKTVISNDFRWEMPYKESEREEINILSVENEIERVEFEKFKNGLKQDLFLIVNLGVDINIENKIKKRKKFLNEFEK